MISNAHYQMHCEIYTYLSFCHYLKKHQIYTVVATQKKKPQYFSFEVTFDLREVTLRSLSNLLVH